MRGLDAGVRIYVAPEALDLDRARALRGAGEVVDEGTSLMIQTRQPGEVLAALAELDALEGLRVKGATLEDVFLTLTGREYRA